MSLKTATKTLTALEPMIASAGTDNHLGTLKSIEESFRTKLMPKERLPMRFQLEIFQQNAVRVVDRLIHTHIMPIILKNLISNGYVPPVTSSGTETTDQD